MKLSLSFELFANVMHLRNRMDTVKIIEKKTCLSI